MKRHYTYAELQKFLVHKHSLIRLRSARAYHDHLDNCPACWNIWNQVRWDRAMKSEGLRELKEYLGPEFHEYFDSSWALAQEWRQKNPSNEEEVSDFYKHTHNYLYNLMVWAESGDREDFTKDFQKFRQRLHVQSVIDWGCGVGTDTLTLLKNGFEVYPVDFECPSVDFLRWRLKKRHYPQHVLNTETLEKLPDADMFWAIDVLEHMQDPLSIFDKLSQKTRLFAHRSEFNNKAGGRHPFHFAFDEAILNKKLKSEGFKHIPWSKLSVWVRQ